MDKERLEAKKAEFETQLAKLTEKYGFSASKEEQHKVIEIGKELEEVNRRLKEKNLDKNDV